MKLNIKIELLILIFLFLLHSVIPHHHHFTNICLQSSHCKDDQPNQNNNREHKSHQHDENSHGLSCEYKKTLALDFSVKKNFKSLKPVKELQPFFNSENKRNQEHYPSWSKKMDETFRINFKQNFLISGYQFRPPPSA